MRGRPFCYGAGMENVQTIGGADKDVIALWLNDRLTHASQNCTDQFAVTLPGGSTPFPILEALIALDPAAPLNRMRVWPNDDRIVPEDHEASNTGKMRALLEPAGASIDVLTEESEPPYFALTWLGMGPDGHTASLFPNTDPQVDDPKMVRRLTPDPLPAHAPFDRITLTLPALLRSDAIVLTLGGSEEKRAVFEKAVAGEHDLPIARLLKAASARGIPVTCFT